MRILGILRDVFGCPVGGQQHGDQQGKQQGESERPGEMLYEFAYRPRHGEHEGEEGQCHSQRGYEQRLKIGVGALDGRFLGRHAVRSVVDVSVDDDNGIVHNHAQHHNQ